MESIQWFVSLVTAEPSPTPTGHLLIAGLPLSPGPWLTLQGGLGSFTLSPIERAPVLHVLFPWVLKSSDLKKNRLGLLKH